MELNNQFINNTVTLNSRISQLQECLIIADNLAAYNKQSLASYAATCQGKERIDSLFVLAYQLAEKLNLIHKEGIILGQITPFNIFVKKIENNFKVYFIVDKRKIAFIENNQLKKIPNYNNPNLLLEYAAPIQIWDLYQGNYPVEMGYHIDFFSLGSVLYELFYGCVPFKCNEIDIIENYLCKFNAPISPDKLNDKISKLFGKIILKLIAPDYKNGYSNAAQLALDLKRVLDACSLMAINEESLYEVNLHKIAHVKGFFGRNKELEQLHDWYKNIANETSGICYINGQTGIGKTCLLSQFLNTTCIPGIFFSVKFDFKSSSSIFKLFDNVFLGFMHQVNDESEVLKNKLRVSLLNSLKNDLYIIQYLMPKLSDILFGKNHFVSSSFEIEAKYRWHSAIIKLMTVFSDYNNSIIIFDNLHVADEDSLEVVESIISALEKKELIAKIFILYQSPVTFSRFQQIINKFFGASISQININLENFIVEDIKKILHQNFAYKRINKIENFSRKIYEITGGKPLDVICQLEKEIDKSNYLDNMIIEDNTANDTTIENFTLVDFNELDYKVIDILGFCACYGKNIPVDLLEQAFINEKNFYSYLSVAIKKGILSTSREGNFQFSHDAYQSTIYERISLQDKKQFFDKIIQLLFSTFKHYKKYIHTISIDDSADYFFELKNSKVLDIANYLNIYLNLSSDTVDSLASNSKLLWAIEINCLAGFVARKLTSYNLANHYIQTAIKYFYILNPNDYIYLLDSLKIEEGLIYYLQGNIERAINILNQCLTNYINSVSQTNNELKIGKVCSVLTQLYFSCFNFHKANEMINRGLAFFNITLPNEAELKLYQSCNFNINFYQYNSNVHTKWPFSAKVYTILALLAEACLLAYINKEYVKFKFYTYQAINIINICGELDSSPYFYAYAAICCINEKKFESAKIFADRAYYLTTHVYINGGNKAKTLNALGALVMHYFFSFSESTEILKIGSEAEQLDPFYSVLCLGNAMILMLVKGIQLTELKLQVSLVKDRASHLNIISAYDIACCYALFIDGIQKSDSKLLDESNFTFEQIERIRDKNANTNAFYLHLNFLLKFWHEEFQAAIEIAEQAEAELNSIPGYAISNTHYFYHALTLIALCKTGDEKLNTYLNKIDLCLSKLKELSHLNSTNYSHIYYLIVAEQQAFFQTINKSNVTIEHTSTIIFNYEKAIELAEKNNFQHELALAKQLFVEYILKNSEYFKNITNLQRAKLHLIDGNNANAIQLYKNWIFSPDVNSIENYRIKKCNILAMSLANKMASITTLFFKNKSPSDFPPKIMESTSIKSSYEPPVSISPHETFICCHPVSPSHNKNSQPSLPSAGFYKFRFVRNVPPRTASNIPANTNTEIKSVKIPNKHVMSNEDNTEIKMPTGQIAKRI